MSSAGHVIDMIRRQAQNRAMQKNMHDNYASRVDMNSTHISTRKFNIEKFGKITKSKIRENAFRIRSEMKREKQMIFLKTLGVLLCIGFTIFAIVNL